MNRLEVTFMKRREDNKFNTNVQSQNLKGKENFLDIDVNGILK
jgi:hypothetical protein